MAVYTEVSDEDLTAFATDYGIGEVLSCKGIAEGIENTNYLVETEAGRFILTLYEKRVKRSDLPFYLGLMEHLAGKGIPCPTPLRTRDGEVLRELCGRPAVMVSFLPGMWPKRPGPAHCAALGEALAKMHLAGTDFSIRRPNDLTVGDWRALFQTSRGHAEGVRPGLTAELENELAFLEANWPSRLPAGVIHADLFPDNVFFRGEALSGLIDFYFACNDFFAYDVAVCMNAWCFEADGEFNATKARRLLRAYRGVREFSPDELAALPVLARGSALRFVLTRLYDWANTPKDALVTPKDPLEFFALLRFHQGVKGPGEYGLE
ncbi:MAG: homoserine kinase [Rhodospirillales bacterium]|jgi:homoserine kinase type II|nr:homoserine kinase [Rhodospirillales bacterium]